MLDGQWSRFTDFVGGWVHCDLLILLCRFTEFVDLVDGFTDFVDLVDELDGEFCIQWPGFSKAGMLGGVSVRWCQVWL